MSSLACEQYGGFSTGFNVPIPSHIQELIRISEGHSAVKKGKGIEPQFVVNSYPVFPVLFYRWITNEVHYVHTLRLLVFGTLEVIPEADYVTMIYCTYVP